MLKTILIAGGLFLYNHSIGQELMIGSKVPDAEFEAWNWSSDKIRLSQLEGRLIILDFWSHNCTNCIRSFARLDSLQQEFKDKVQIVLVNKETKEANDIFFSKRKKLTRPRVPFITGDSILNKLFPHSGDPYHVWIDQNGNVCYMTDEYNATKENINEFLEGKQIKARNFGKISFIPSIFDSSFLSSVDYFSCLSHCLNHIFLSSDRKRGYDGLVFNCHSAVDLFRKAFEENGKLELNRPGRMAVEVKDSFKYLRPGDVKLKNEWQEKYSYNYQLLVPEERAGEKFALMRKDLERYFNLHATLETRTIKCIVLVRSKKQNAIHTKKRKDSSGNLNTIGYTDMIARIRGGIESGLRMPFIDSTESSGNDITRMPVPDAQAFYDLGLLRQELLRHGLDIEEKMCPITVLVIKENR